jgi:hypothetical protein
MRKPLGCTLLKRELAMRATVLPLALVLAACASANVMRLDDVRRPPRPPQAVQLLLDQPTRPFRAIALIEVSDEGWGLSLETLRRKLTQEAAKLGGDAVVLTRRSSQAGTVLMPVGSSWYAANITESGLVGQVIIYEPSGK